MERDEELAMAGHMQGRVAVVTGGASGIGRACALRLAQEGADVVIGDLLLDGGKQTVSLVEGLGRRAHFVPTDTSREADCDALAAAAVERFGRIDALVAAAGISHAHYVSGQDDASRMRDREAGFLLRKPVGDWERVLAVNLTGVMLSDRSVIRRMIELGTPGSIVNIASGAAKIPILGAADYCVSKAGVWMLTKALALEVAPHRIRVNAIGPGFIQTPMTAGIHTQPERREQILRGTPLGRLGEPEDIANAALFLASDESSFFTGQILHPDGGLFTG
jgi:NAD(P)-dependent dehydrogenase (short-subunit alcohol dehydrogenase family)